MSLPKNVRLVEVGPRDGLQNEAQPISVADKVRLVDDLTDAGLAYIEVGSFVSPKWVPQMAGSAEVFRRYPATCRRDLRRAGAQPARFRGRPGGGVKEVAVFAAALEAFSSATSTARSATASSASSRSSKLRSQGVRVRGYVSCVLGCPYEGRSAPSRWPVARALHEMGCYEVSLGDTIGTGTGDTRRLFEVVSRQVPREQLAGHFHDTYGQALANVYASLLEGIAVFDSSVAGLGGCPYAKGATGNVATEDVLYLLQGLGIETGIDLDRLIAAGLRISEVLGRATGSRHGHAARAESHRCHISGWSVTAHTAGSKKSGNRETNRQNFRCQVFSKIAKSLILKGFKSWHGTCYISGTTRTKKATSNKNNMKRL
jgi:hydroxymethylglutaryl-CoA lyase